jgi:hypothetical protein
MKITKDNLNFQFSDGMWYCTIYISCGFVRPNGWAWGETATQALYLAKRNADKTWIRK